jgi:hypothetical protein
VQIDRDRIISICVVTAQGGKGKYNSDWSVSLSRAAVVSIIELTFANVNKALGTFTTFHFLHNLLMSQIS